MVVAPERGTRAYSLKGDSGEKTIFRLRGLDAREMLAIVRHPAFSGKQELPEKPNTDPEQFDAMVLICRMGITGWEKLKTAAGEDAPFETEEVNLPGVGRRCLLTEKCLIETLRADQVFEIASEIVSQYLAGVLPKVIN